MPDKVGLIYSGVCFRDWNRAYIMIENFKYQFCYGLWYVYIIKPTTHDHWGLGIWFTAPWWQVDVKYKAHFLLNLQPVIFVFVQFYLVYTVLAHTDIWILTIEYFSLQHRTTILQVMSINFVSCWFIDRLLQFILGNAKMKAAWWNLLDLKTISIHSLMKLLSLVQYVCFAIQEADDADRLQAFWFYNNCIKEDTRTISWHHKGLISRFCHGLPPNSQHRRGIVASPDDLTFLLRN
jgi:hypothetical protein